MIRLYTLVAVFTLVVAACGGSDDATSTSATASAGTGGGEATTTTTTTPAETTTTAAVTTTTVPPTTTSSTLAGQVIDFFPQPGDVLSVVGVAHDDVLNVRAAPGIFNDVVDTIDPDGTTVALGSARDLGRAIWVEHDTGGALGWSNYAFLAFAGATDDATAEVVGLLGEVPTAETMEALGLIVAGSQVSTLSVSIVVMTVAATVGELGEVTYDVVGLGDDSVYGYRLRVIGEPFTDGFVLRTVERTALCGRGVDEAGLCV